jgi:hypothetical protein
MKKVIELLRKANESLCRVASWMRVLDSIATATDYINEALVELKALDRWYTPEQWEKRTGAAWPDKWSVYVRYRGTNGTFCTWLSTLYSLAKYEPLYKTEKQIVCATEAGPPPNDWWPEEAQ